MYTKKEKIKSNKALKKAIKRGTERFFFFKILSNFAGT